MDCESYEIIVPLQPENEIMFEMKRIYLLFSAILFCMNGIAGVVSEIVNDTSRVVDLDEVVVVAQPKEQTRLRLQPLSSSVFSSEQMQQLNVRDLSQLSQYVPSFSMPA